MSGEHAHELGVPCLWLALVRAPGQVGVQGAHRLPRLRFVGHRTRRLSERRQRMGMYDQIEVGGRHGQVKLWDNQLTTFKLGDIVPPVRMNVPDFEIAMREGGYVHVRALKITGWDDER